MTDAFGDVIPRPPAQETFRAVDAGVGADRVTGPPFGVTRLHRTVSRAVKGVQELADGGSRAGTQVDDRRWPGQGVEAGERGHGGRGPIPAMAVVPYAWPPPGRPVRSGRQERKPLSSRLDPLAPSLCRPPHPQRRTPP